MRHAQHWRNLGNFHAPPVQSHHLFVPFVLGLAREPASVFFVHSLHVGIAVHISGVICRVYNYYGRPCCTGANA
jgi:hypothetical protein